MLDKIMPYQNIILVFFYAENLLRNLNAQLSARTRESRVYFKFEITNVFWIRFIYAYSEYF